MSKFISLFMASILLVSVSPAFAKGKKTAKTKSAPTTTNKVILVNPELLQIIESAKKYRSVQAPEKSQFETQSEYEIRIATSRSTNLETIIGRTSVKTEFKYDAEDQSLIVSLGESASSSIYVDGLRVFSKDIAILDKKVKKTTCTNGYGAKFNYEYTAFTSDEYGITYLDSKNFSNRNDPSWSDALSKSYGYTSFKSKYSSYEYGEFSFKIPMSVNDARNYQLSVSGSQ